MFNFGKRRASYSQSVQERKDEFEQVLNTPIIDLQKLEDICFHGIPEDRELKAKCWKILLGYLPTETSKWKQHLQHQRNLYEFYINLLFQTPETTNNAQGTNNSDSPHEPPYRHQRSKTLQRLQSNSPEAAHTPRAKKSPNLSLFQAETRVRPFSARQTKSTIISNNYFQTNQAVKIDTIFDENNEENAARTNALFEEDEEEDSEQSDKDEEPEPEPEAVPEPEPVENSTKYNDVENEDSSNNSNNSNNSKEDQDDVLENRGSVVIKRDSAIAKLIPSVETDFADEEYNDITLRNADSPSLIVITPGSHTRESLSKEDDLKNPLLIDIPPEEVQSFEPKPDPEFLAKLEKEQEQQEQKQEEQKTKVELNTNLNFEKVNKITDPLSTLPNNPWKTYFDDWDIWNRIEKDINRTHQTYAFFRSDHMIPDKSVSKTYRFPFDIVRKTPTPLMTPTLSSMTYNTRTDFTIAAVPPSPQNTTKSQLDKLNAILTPPVNSNQFFPLKGTPENEEVNHDKLGAPPLLNCTSAPVTPGDRLIPSLKIEDDDEIIEVESVSDSDDGNGYQFKFNGVQPPSYPPPPVPNTLNAPLSLTKTASVPSYAQPKQSNSNSNRPSTPPIYNTIDANKKARIEKYVMDSKQHGIHAQIMIRILCVYARLNKGVEYVQGMNELLAPIYYVFTLDTSQNNIYAEADSFFCFMNLMSYLADRFIPEADNSQFGILAIVESFDKLLKRIDLQLWRKFKHINLDATFFALRWLMLLMAMEFQLPEVLRLWDSFLSDHNRFQFVTYFAISMVELLRPQLMQGSFASNLQLLQKYPTPDLYELLLPAIQLRDKYPSQVAKKAKKKKKKKQNKNRKVKKKNTRSKTLTFGLNIINNFNSKATAGKASKSPNSNLVLPWNSRVARTLSPRASALAATVNNKFQFKKPNKRTVSAFNLFKKKITPNMQKISSSINLNARSSSSSNLKQQVEDEDETNIKL